MTSFSGCEIDEVIHCSTDRPPGNPWHLPTHMSADLANLKVLQIFIDKFIGDLSCLNTFSKFQQAY